MQRRPRADGVLDGRVDAERHVGLEAVVDHRGDLGAVAREGRLALDHRGDDQDVVLGQVLLGRVAEVDAARQLRSNAASCCSHEARGRDAAWSSCRWPGTGTPPCRGARCPSPCSPPAAWRRARRRGRPSARCRPWARHVLAMSRIALPSGIVSLTAGAAVRAGAQRREDHGVPLVRAQRVGAGAQAAAVAVQAHVERPAAAVADDARAVQDVADVLDRASPRDRHRHTAAPGGPDGPPKSTRSATNSTPAEDDQERRARRAAPAAPSGRASSSAARRSRKLWRSTAAACVVARHRGLPAAGRR